MADQIPPKPPKPANELFGKVVLPSPADNEPRNETPLQEESEVIRENADEAIKLEKLYAHRINRDERRRYTPRVWWFTIIWSSFMAAMLILSCIIPFNKWFEISDSVIIALITTATINAFSFFVLILKYVYSDSHL